MKLKMKEVHLDSLDGRAKVQQVGEKIKLNKKLAFDDTTQKHRNKANKRHAFTSTTTTKADDNNDD